MENRGVAPLNLNHWMDASGYIPNLTTLHPGKETLILIEYETEGALGQILVIWRTEFFLFPAIKAQCLSPLARSVVNVLTELFALPQYCVLHNVLFLPCHRTETSNTRAKQ